MEVVTEVAQMDRAQGQGTGTGHKWYRDGW